MQSQPESVNFLEVTLWTKVDSGGAVHCRMRQISAGQSSKGKENWESKKEKNNKKFVCWLTAVLFRPWVTNSRQEWAVDLYEGKFFRIYLGIIEVPEQTTKRTPLSIVCIYIYRYGSRIAVWTKSHQQCKQQRLSPVTIKQAPKYFRFQPGFELMSCSLCPIRFHCTKAPTWIIWIRLGFRLCR